MHRQGDGPTRTSGMAISAISEIFRATIVDVGKDSLSLSC